MYPWEAVACAPARDKGNREQSLHVSLKSLPVELAEGSPGATPPVVPGEGNLEATFSKESVLSGAIVP